jgi:tetratricopeptide (TPR) repeat protein
MGTLKTSVLGSLVVLVGLLATGCSKSAADYVKSGDEFAAAGKTREALIEYRNAVQKEAANGPARLKLAQTHEKLGEIPQAFREYVRAADLLPKDAALQVKAGMLLMIAGRNEDAKVRAERALAVDPRNVEAQLLLGNTSAGLKDLDGALKQIEEAIALAPSSDRGYASLGMVQLAKGNAEAAEAAFRKAVEVGPKSMQAHLGLGNFLWAANRRDEAVQSFERALAIDPKHVLANRLMATFHASGPTPAKAEPYFRALADLPENTDGKLALAEYYLRMGRQEEGKKTLLAAASQAATYAPATRRLAALAFGEGRKADAYKQADEVLAKNPKDADTLVMKGRMQAADGKIDDALATFKAAVAAEPNNVGAQFALGSAYAGKRDVDPAIVAFTEVLRLNPRASAAQLQLANLYLAKGQVKQSSSMSADALRNAPGNPMARLVRARTLMADGQLQEAGVVMVALEKEFPKAWPVQAQLGTYHAVRGEFVKARAAWEAALALNPNSYEANQGLVRLELSERKPDAAWARATSLADAHPTDARYRVEQGRVAIARRDMPGAEAALRKAIEVDPAAMDAYGMLGQVYLSQKKLDQARTEFERLVQKQPRSVGAHTLIGLILQQQGKAAEAMDQYRRTIEINPKAAVASNNLAWMQATSGGNLDQALQYAQAAQQVLPEQAEVNDTLGYIYLKKNIPTLAVGPMLKAVEKDPKNATYRYRLGEAYLKSGNKVQAKTALAAALEMTPTFPEAAEARALLAQVQ